MKICLMPTHALMWRKRGDLRHLHFGYLCINLSPQLKKGAYVMLSIISEAFFGREVGGTSIPPL